MPRRARLAVAGLPWHIVQRGNNRSACFFQVSDFCKYLELLGECSSEAECKVHAYVLMTNHVHLLVTPKKKAGGSQMMKGLGQRYVQYINKKYSRTGTLWEGRFKSCITQTDQYVLACYRYIEMNPVRAGMVEHPHLYRWSSYRANAGLSPNALISPHATFLELGTNAESRIRNYTAMFSDQLKANVVAEIRSATTGNFMFGGKAFKKNMSKILGRRVTRSKRGPRSGRGSVPN